MMRTFVVLLLAATQLSCVRLPDDIMPVSNFDADRYLGQWYEIARLDHSFERGMQQVTATYEPRDDGSIRVLNKGYLVEDKEWKTAEGKAYFVDDEEQGFLKVSFFGPFYGAYVVFKLDQDNYQWAYVTSYNRDYLWLLSRSPAISDQRRQDFLRTAARYGFDTEALIFVQH